MPGGFSRLAPKLEGRIGDTVRATVMRAGRLVYLDPKVEAREVARYRMAELERLGAAQLKVRDGWLSNRPGRGGAVLAARLGGGQRARIRAAADSPTPK